MAAESAVTVDRSVEPGGCRSRGARRARPLVAARAGIGRRPRGVGSRHPLPTSSWSTSRTASRPTTRVPHVARSSRSPRRGSDRGCASATRPPTNGARMSRCCAAPTSWRASCSRRSRRPSTCDAPPTRSAARCRSSRSSRAPAASRPRSRSPRRPASCASRSAAATSAVTPAPPMTRSPCCSRARASSPPAGQRGFRGRSTGRPCRATRVVLAEASRHAASVGMTGRLCLREEQVAAVNDALSPSASELAWAVGVLDTLDRCGIRDGSDLPRIARAQALLDAAVGVRHRHGCRRGRTSPTTRAERREVRSLRRDDRTRAPRSGRRASGRLRRACGARRRCSPGRAARSGTRRRPTIVITVSAYSPDAAPAR